MNAEASTDEANNKLAGLIKKNCEECTSEPFLFKYAKIRLYSEFENGKNVGGKINQLYLFGAVALLILLMACINFMNLSTARSATRGKEVGIRKSIGAKKSGLVLQFMIESILVAFVALIIAISVVQLILPYFNEITGKAIEIDFTSPLFIIGTLAITLFCGLVAGSYPAFILSRFNTVKVLKGNQKSGLAGNSLRKFLVVVQFATSVVLVIGSLVVYKQIQFINETDLGFDKENLLVVNQNEGIVRNYALIKNELNQLPAVSQIAFGGNNIFTVPITTTDIGWNGKPETSSTIFKLYRCDASFIPAMNIQLLGGRNFIDEQDAKNYIINAKAAEVMGLNTEDAVGFSINVWGWEGQVVGITNDFHNDNLKNDIKPMIFMYSENLGAHYFIKLDDKQAVNESVAQIQTVFAKHNSEYPFEYTLLEDVFGHQYQSEAVMGQLALGFTFIAIFISCLGLFGLASFMAERRTKEVGIRKVLGASVTSLMILLFSDFTTLAFISLIIGCPIAWYFTDMYLAGYVYHTEITWSIYALTALLMMVITIVSVGYQSNKAATSNPIDSMRSE